MVAGFLELGDRGGLTVTVLDAAAVLAHVERLKYADRPPARLARHRASTVSTTPRHIRGESEP